MRTHVTKFRLLKQTDEGFTLIRAKMMEVYIYILLVSLGCIETEALHAECEAPASPKGSVAFVTCRFDSDISKFRQDFEVRRVPVNDSFMNTEVVISCYWNQEKSVCRSRPDYQLDSPVTRQFTVKITEVGSRHAGKFICMLVSHDPGMYDYCELVVTGNESDKHNELTSHLSTVTTGSVRHNEYTSGFSILNGNESDHKELTSTLPTGNIADAFGNIPAIAVLIIAVSIILIIIFFILRKGNVAY